MKMEKLLYITQGQAVLEMKMKWKYALEMFLETKEQRFLELTL